MRLTKEQARRWIVTYQGFDKSTEDVHEAIMDFIKKVGCIQFDPLDMVGYNPYLVLQARVKGFQAQHLQELLYKEHRLVDGWDKNMAIYPVEDWPYFTRYRQEAQARLMKGDIEVRSILPELRSLLQEKGPSSSLDFDFDTIVNWAWSPTKASRAALESLFYCGELVVQNKIGTRRVYDFAQRVLPEVILTAEDPNRSLEAYHAWHLKRRINAIGLLWNKASDAWLGIHWMKTKERNEAFQRLLAQGELMEIEVEGLEVPLYIDSRKLPQLEAMLETDAVDKRMHFLAPLDNMLWDRKLLSALFGFDYRWEVYKPIVERDYGYYVLPILYGDLLIGRFEPVFDKKTKVLLLKNWWWEDGVALTVELGTALNEAMQQFMLYLGAKTLSISKSGKTTKDLRAIKKLI